MRCHDFIVYSFQGSRDTGKIARKRSSRALTSRILRSRECCTAENIQWQQRKKAWSTAPPLPCASLQISLPPAPLRVCIPLLVVVFIFYKWRRKCPQGGLVWTWRKGAFLFGCPKGGSQGPWRNFARYRGLRRAHEPLHSSLAPGHRWLLAFGRGDGSPSCNRAAISGHPAERSLGTPSRRTRGCPPARTRC